MKYKALLPYENDIREMFFNEGLSSGEIYSRLGVSSDPQLRRYLRDMGFIEEDHTKSIYNSRKPKSACLEQKAEYIFSEFVHKDVPITKIAKVLGSSTSPIKRILKSKYNINGHKDRLKWKREKIRESENYIKFLYVEQEKGSDEVSKSLGFKCPPYLIQEFLKELGIMRNRSEAAILKFRKKWTLNSQEKFFQDWCLDQGLECIYQYQITENGHNYDFYLPELNALVEIDGDFWHGLDGVRHDAEELQERDRKLTIMAKKKGYNIFRFPTSQLRRENTKPFYALLSSLTYERSL